MSQQTLASTAPGGGSRIIRRMWVSGVRSRAGYQDAGLPGSPLRTLQVESYGFGIQIINICGFKRLTEKLLLIKTSSYSSQLWQALQHPSLDVRCHYSLPEKMPTQTVQIFAKYASVTDVDDVCASHALESPRLVNNVTPVCWPTNNQVLQPGK